MNSEKLLQTAETKAAQKSWHAPSITYIDIRKTATPVGSQTRYDPLNNNNRA